MIYQGKEIIFRNNSYNDTTNASAFAKTTTNATLSNIKFDKIVIFAREYIGIVSAKDTNSAFDRISVTDSYVEGRSQSNGGGQCTSMFIGKASGSKVTNCYVQGELRYYQANKTAAVIGEATNVTVDKVISDVTIPYYFNDIASGFIGAFTNDTTSKVTNSVVLGDIDVTNGVGRRKFVASSNGTDDTAINQVILRIFENCYENSDSIGTSNSNETTKNNIKTQSKEKFEDKDFYINTLGFDETIWNLENINNLKKYNRYQTYITVETTEIVDIGLK
jgi:hypothetical protein